VKAEPLVLLFPGDLGYYDPVCAYWQWTIDRYNAKKVNNWDETSISSITREHDGRLRLGFDFDNIYFFVVTVAEDANTVELTMRDKNGTTSGPQILRQTFRGPAKIPSCSVYVDKFQERYYAQDEMLTVVVPDGFDTVGRYICVYFQWTMDAKGVMNSNNKIINPFQILNRSAGGSATFTFKSEDSYYTWDGNTSN
jgi:hypothetical protein